jgi:hypothetical protein
METPVALWLLSSIVNGFPNLKWTPEIVDAYFNPVFWAGVATMIASLVATLTTADTPRAKCLRAVTLSIVGIYVGCSVTVITLLACRLFLVVVIDAPVSQSRAGHGRFYCWICALAILWAVSVAVVSCAGLRCAFSALSPKAAASDTSGSPSKVHVDPAQRGDHRDEL